MMSLLDANIMVMSALLVVFVGFLKWRKLSKKQNYPPLNPEGMLETTAKFMDGTVPEFLFQKMKKLGKVFRVNLPELSMWIMVGDAKLARKIFEEESEKPSSYKRFQGLTKGVPTIFTRFTRNDGWELARKGIASSFSMTNITKTFSALQENLDELLSRLQAHAEGGNSFEITELMLAVTMDFIASAMFGVKYHSVRDGASSEGQKILDELNVTLKEFGLKVSDEMI
jgi:hypothetical protein